MWSRLRSYRPSHALVVAYLALFFAVGGGTAVALTGSNTVFSDDITDNEVRTADVRNDNLSGGGLGGADIRPNGLTGSDVKESTLGTVPNADKVDGAHAPVWALVNNKSLVRGRGATSASQPSMTAPTIRVIFNRDVSQCAYTVTVDAPWTTGRFGTATAGPTNNSVDVVIYDHTGSSSSTEKFSLVANC